jgi:hypothetical protein
MMNSNRCSVKIKYVNWNVRDKLKGTEIAEPKELVTKFMEELGLAK